MEDSIHLVDGFPMPACKYARASGSRCFKGEAGFSYCAAKDEKYYGFEGHVIPQLSLDYFMDRRQFTQLALFAALLPPFGNSIKAAESDEQRRNLAKIASQRGHKAMMDAPGVKMVGNEKIAMLLYPGFYAPDLINPQFLFNAMMGAEVCLISPTDDLTPVDCGGFSIVPTHRRSECPNKPDVLFVPGGANGTLEAMKKQAVY